MDEVTVWTIEPPAFLDEIHATVIGFGGCGLVVALFAIAHYQRIGLGWSLFLAIVLYFIAIGTGIFVTGYLSDRGSAFVAGFWAPLVYSLLLAILIRIFYKPKINISTSDHLIDT